MPARLRRVSLPERTVDLLAVRERAEEILRAEFGDADLTCVVFDETQRQIDEFKRGVNGRAAELGQELLTAVDKCLNLAGNAVWNSPAGTADLAVERAQELLEALSKALSGATRMSGEIMEYDALLTRSVTRNVEQSWKKRLEEARGGS